METRKVAIACQGGGIHGAFTCGVLSAILQAKEDEVQGVLPEHAKRNFEIVGLSGTSAGALNAFMVWYGLMAKGERPGSFAEARKAVNNLWDTFQVRTIGETVLNTVAQQMYKLNEKGISVTPPRPAYFYDWLMSALGQWSVVEGLVAPKLDLREIRPEFYDFAALLRTCAPEFPVIEADLSRIAAKRIRPRVVLGSVEVLSGEFEAFDSWSNPDLPPRERRPISYEAVEASGTLPELRRSQRIPGILNRDGNEGRYWDGLFSQNPPIRELVARTPREDRPDEIWVVRINPKRCDNEPESLAAIGDRRNELAGNHSLNLELRFLNGINQLLARLRPLIEKHPEDPILSPIANFIPIKTYMITMSKEKNVLGVGSKMDRSPEFVTDMRQHGEARAAAFLPLWLSDSQDLLEWPGDALALIDRGC